MFNNEISFVFDLQRFADTKFNIATGNTVLSSDNLTIDASKVTSGTLAIARGGTGQTVNPSMLTNLATTAAANVFATSPRPGVTGTLGVGNGGTGLTASPSMLTNLNSTTAANVFQASPRPGVTGTLSVANGGTGQTVLSAVNVGGATKATQDSDGNQINTTYAKLSGATFTGDIILGQGKQIIAQGTKANYPIITNAYSNTSGYGQDVIVSAGQALVMGAGEAPQNVYNETAVDAQDKENAYLVADQTVYIMANCNTVANRKVFTFGTNGVLTATGFSGPLTGNVTGNVSGSSGSCTGNAVTASSLQTARALQVSLSNTSAANFQGNGDVKTIGVQGILAVANGGTGTNSLANITVGKANTLTTARALQVSLSSTGAPTFNGTADVKTIGVTGTLAIGNGGTGMTSNPSMLTNLGTTTAANVFQASPRPGVTGTLPVANGGTGQTNLSNVAVGSAAKFTSAQTINLTGDVTGSVSSAAGWTINTLRRSCVVGTNNTANSKPWYKVCSASFTGASQDKVITMLVHHQSSFFLFGILRIYVRREKSSWSANSSAQWMLNYGFTLSDFVLVLSTDLTTAELWVNIPSTAQRRQFIVLSESDNVDLTQYWTFYPAVSAGQKASIDTAGTQKISTMCSYSIKNQQLPSYCVCSTAAATVAKTATCENFHDLQAGAHVTVKFTVTNTAANPTLNINSTGAKAIYYRGQPIVPEAIQANTTLDFVYNGSQYDVIGSLVWTTANP